MEDIKAEDGWVDHVVAREFPGLRLRYTVIPARPEASPAELKDRLADLSNRYLGFHAMSLPRQPIPTAYRVFLRQVGLDPDTQPSPVEAASRERIVRGSFASHDRICDALTIATVESQVALSVVDADSVELPLGIRPVRADDHSDLALGTLALADANREIASLFGSPRLDCEVGPRTRSVAAAAIGVEGIADWMLDDALWRFADIAA